MATNSLTQVPRPIRQLPVSVVNKIAAGEVIERPASVIKELLENSIDAGASQIEVAVENGGLDSLRVTDNGSGISRNDLPLAVTSHATSKILNADDLFQVGTFGFRGEALASIAEISEFTLRTRTSAEENGHELRVLGGKSESIEPVGCPPGTTILVENLFFNTPVRRKFMRAPQTEFGHISEAFARIALGNPQCHLTLIHNGKVQFQLNPTSDWATRIEDFFGPEIGNALIPVENREHGQNLTGFVVDPSVTRSHNRMQYLFLNGRYIRDRSLQHALQEAYRGLIMTGRFPICFLRLEIPFDQVDVNVHPAKLEVRFQDSGKVYSHLLATLRNRFLTTDLTARGHFSREINSRRELSTGIGLPQVGYSSSELSPAHAASSFSLFPSPTESQSRLAFPAAPPRDWITNPLERVRHLGSPGATPSLEMPSLANAGPHLEPASGTFGLTDTELARSGESEDGQRPSQQATPELSVPNREQALQVYDTYLITETEEGLVIIDQHALHERILYEQFKAKIRCGDIETQKLLVPEPVTLRPPEVAAVLEQRAVLLRLGIGVEPFGGDTLLIASFPTLLAGYRPSEMVRNITDKLLTEGAILGPEDLLDELLHMFACKAAVKAGDRLTRQEINDLIAFRNYCRDAHHCPHGRPTALVFSREELDKKFKRI